MYFLRTVRKKLPGRCNLRYKSQRDRQKQMYFLYEMRCSVSGKSEKSKRHDGCGNICRDKESMHGRKTEYSLYLIFTPGLAARGYFCSLRIYRKQNIYSVAYCIQLLNKAIRYINNVVIIAKQTVFYYAIIQIYILSIDFHCAKCYNKAVNNKRHCKCRISIILLSH